MTRNGELSWATQLADGGSCPVSQDESDKCDMKAAEHHWVLWIVN